MPQPPNSKLLRWRLLAALLIGAAGVFAFAPFDWFPLNWLSLGALFVLVAKAALLLGRDGAVHPAVFVQRIEPRRDVACDGEGVVNVESAAA